MQNFKKFKSHKTVFAAKIVSVNLISAVLVVENKAGEKEAVQVDAPWLVRHTPKPKGYLVVYEDGYMAYSPKEAFESRYTELGVVIKDGLTFGEAVNALKSGKRVARKGWNGKGMFLKYVQSYPCNGYGMPATPFTTANAEEKDIKQATHEGQMRSFIMMKTAGNSAYWGEGFSDFVPWLASQSDILEEDWEILD